MIFDVNNPPAQPDSTLDSDVALAQIMPIQGDQQVSIAPGDWVDVDPSCLPADPNWGYSFQVASVTPNANPNLAVCTILVSMDQGQTYQQVDLSSAYWVQNNFRRVPNV